jgi:hypothetical protein
VGVGAGVGAMVFRRPLPAQPRQSRRPHPPWLGLGEEHQVYSRLGVAEDGRGAATSALEVEVVDEVKSGMWRPLVSSTRARSS